MSLLKNFSFRFPARSRNQNLIGIDLNDEHVKIVHVRLTGLKREVANVMSREVRGLSDDDISLFIRQTMDKLQLKDARVFLSVPQHLVITRSIEIPSRDPEEIREIVNLQASRHTPYSRSEIIVDMMNLGLVRENYTKVLLIIVPKEIVVRQSQILNKAGLKLDKVLFSPEGICQACSKILSLENSDATTAIVHMDAILTSFLVVQRNRILFVRGIPVGANHLLEEKEIYYDRFVDELQKSLEAYASDEMGPSPKSLILTGVVGEVNDLDDLFLETLHIPIKHQTYFNHFPISDAAKSVAQASRRVSFFNLIAPMLLFDKIHIDLTTDDNKFKKQLEEKARQMVKTGVLVMLLLSLVFASLASKIYFKKEALNHLISRYRPVREDAKHLETLYEKTQGVKEYLAHRGQALETLVEVYSTIPADVRVTEIKYDDTRKFSIKGTSGVMGSVFNFVANLEKSDIYDSVKTKYVTNRNENGSDVTDFEINGLVVSSGAAK